MRLVLRRTDIASAMAALGLVLAKSDFTSFVAALGVLDSDTSADDTEDKLSELSQGSVVSFILLVFIECESRCNKYLCCTMKGFQKLASGVAKKPKLV